MPRTAAIAIVCFRPEPACPPFSQGLTLRGRVKDIQVIDGPPNSLSDALRIPRCCLSWRFRSEVRAGAAPRMRPRRTSRRCGDVSAPRQRPMSPIPCRRAAAERPAPRTCLANHQALIVPRQNGSCAAGDPIGRNRSNAMPSSLFQYYWDLNHPATLVVLAPLVLWFLLTPKTLTRRLRRRRPRLAPQRSPLVPAGQSLTRPSSAWRSRTACSTCACRTLPTTANRSSRFWPATI